MTTTTTTKKITIHMSERSPVKIAVDDWPLIASVGWYNGEHECQANTVRAIKVRQHEDGRTVVYGWEDEGPGGQHASFRATYAGFMLAAGEDVARAIRRVAGLIGDDKLGDECIADLPAEEI